MNLPEAWHELDAFDTFTYLIVCPLGILASLALMIAHIVYKELRKQPGDLVFMIALSEFLLSTHWLMSAIHTGYITTAYEDDSPFCKFNSVLALLAGTMDTFYNVSFLFYVLFAIRNAVQKGWKPYKTFHIANAAIVVLLFVLAARGRNKYGTCSVRVGKNSMTVSSFVLFVSIVIAIVVYQYTKRSLPSLGVNMAKLRRDFLNFYGSYIKAYIIICCVVFFSFFCQFYGENQNDPDAKKNYKGTLFNLGKLGNTAKALLPLVLFFIRSQDPVIKKRIFKPYEKVANQLTQFIKDISPSTRPKGLPGTTISLEGSADSENIETRHSSDTRIANNLEDELITESDDVFWMELLPGKAKEAFTRTFLASIQSYYPSQISILATQADIASPRHASDLVDLQIDGESLMRSLGTAETICSCRMTIQSPMLFRDILVNNQRVVNFNESFDIGKNQVNIQQAGENKGGASGELFMFSHDSQLIIKTVSLQDEIELTKLIYDYSQYHRYNKGSMMTKILGLFQFKIDGTPKPIKLMVMENIFTIPKEAILRKYDCKGSQYQRKVLPKPEDFDIGVSVKQILKDMDFLAIEKQIDFLDKQHRATLLAAIKSDVDFFTSHGIIDYSMIIALVRLRQIDQPYIDKELLAGGFHLIATTNPEFFYMIGIIDYLQTYTWGKSLERLFKRIKTCNPRLQTSSQPPEKYSIRFYDFVSKCFV